MELCQQLRLESESESVTCSATISLIPRPRSKIGKGGLVTLANFLVCAESAYYVTIMW